MTIHADPADTRDARADDLDRDYRMLIDGEWVEAADGATFQCVDPFTAQPWGRVPVATADQVDQAVRAARRAFTETDWPRLPPIQRATILRRLGTLIEEHADRLVHQQIRENGKLVSEMGPGILSVAGDAHFYAGLAEQLHGHTMGAPFPNFTTYTVREPIGVVAAITPWNTPLGLLGWKLFPALAAGNTVVAKPSEVTPTSTLLLAELAVEAGVPKGVFNVVTGLGPVGAALVEHPGVDKIAFTGSTATGLRINAIAAARGAHVSLELGGKSPQIVFEDADLSNAANGVMAGVFAATGQTCIAGSRVLVADAVYDEFAGLLAERSKQMRHGDPLDPGSQLGPVASRPQLEKVESYVAIGRGEAQLLAGGERPDHPGLFHRPTVFGDVAPDARIAREEIFGPVASLMRFKDEEEALRIANDTVFGLAAGVWTENVRRAHRVASRVRAGTVWVNNYRLMAHAMPFGGYGQSGLGRELGIEALHGYTEVKSVWIDTGNDVAPIWG
jgi:(Z)-2-((N-methylformamido)methylene)-5-hydroxybutyrolactone dehydrogenase